MEAIKYHTWSKDANGNVNPRSDNGYENLFCFKINNIPKKEGSADEATKYFLDSSRSQKLFIETLKAIFPDNNSKYYIEYRIVNNPAEKTNALYIILNWVTKSICDKHELSAIKNQIFSILPKDFDYKYVETSDNDFYNLTSFPNDVRFVEINKYTSFQSTNDVVADGYITPIDKFTFSNFYEEFSSNSVDKTAYLIPCTTYIGYENPSFQSLFALLQNLNQKVQLRISISLTDISETEQKRALLYKGILNYVHEQAGLSSDISYQSSYDKLVANNSIYYVKIEVAAENIFGAKVISDAFCSSYDGYDPMSNKPNIQPKALFSFDPKLPSYKDKIHEWKHFYHRYDSDRSDILFPKVNSIRNIYDDDRVTGFMPFLLRFPYLCDINEVSALFKLPVADAAGIPGLISKPVKPFYQPNSVSEYGDEKKISFGNIISSSSAKSDIPYTLPVSDLTKHGLIVGATGSGKTNTALNFVKSLTEQNIPFLIIEPVKSEYYHELNDYFKSKGKKLNRFNFKNPFSVVKNNNNKIINTEFLRFNPLFPIDYNSLEPENRISLLQHMSYIMGCFNAAFPMYGIAPKVLQECLYDLYYKLFDEKESGLFDSTVSPKYIFDKRFEELNAKEKTLFGQLNINALLEQIEEHLDDDSKYSQEEKKEMGNVLRRRIGFLTRGVLGNVLCPELWKDENPERTVAISNDVSEKISNSEFTEEEYRKAIELIGYDRLPDYWLDKDCPLIPNNIATIFTEPTIIELEHLSENDDKALIMAFLLTYLFEYRQTKKSIKQIKAEEGGNFKIDKHIHITIIEEAHRLLSSSSVSSVGGGEDSTVTEDSKSKSISLFIDMLAEIRAKGEGIFIVEQSPIKLIKDVIKNTNLKIMHRMTSKEDRDHMGSAMNMNEQQKDYVNTLKRGDAIVFDEKLDNPVFIAMKEYKMDS